MTLKRILIMAGGTGGHVFPGLALAQFCREQGVDVHWLGTELGLEARLVPAANIPLHLVQIKGLRGKGWLARLTAPFAIFRALWQSLRIIRRIKPDIVMGMGGFVSGPGGLAAWISGVPLLVHEQNAKPGMTNLWLAKVAKRVLAGFPQAFGPDGKAILVGNPVRKAIEALPAPSCTERTPFHLLVLGGSLGAQALNETVPEALSLLPPNLRPIVRHQTGEKHWEKTQKLYENKGLMGDVQAFIEDMAQSYAWADVVLCRAGALTVAELCVAGRGAIFVPFPFAVDDHQTANAFYMVQQGAAKCVPQAQLSAAHLAELLKELTVSPDKRVAMAKAAYELRNVQVVEKIYDICEEVCR